MVVSQSKLLKSILKNEGNQSKTAKDLGIAQQSVSRRLVNNPHLKKAVLNAREQALKEAGLTRPVIYKTIARHIKAKQYVIIDGIAKVTKAPDYQTQKDAYRTSLHLMRDLKDDTNETPASSIGNIVFNILMASKREGIQVV